MTQEVLDKLEQTVVINCDDSSHARGKTTKVQTFVRDDCGWKAQFEPNIELGSDGIVRHRLSCKLCQRNGYYRDDTIRPALNFLLSKNIHKVNIRTLEMVIRKLNTAR